MTSGLTAALSNQLTSPNPDSNTEKPSSRQRQVRSEPPASRAPTEIVLKDGPVPIHLPVFKPKNENSVIKIIQKEWDREVQRLNSKSNNKIPGLGEKSLV
jgi:hypothetical protein